MCSAVQPKNPPRKKKKKETMPHDISTNGCYEREKRTKRWSLSYPEIIGMNLFY